MNTITENFGTLYHPVKAFVVYQSGDKECSPYVQAYDMDAKGYPINAHPLTVRESTALAKALDTSPEHRKNYLKPEGLLPENVLQINPDNEGFAIWYTPALKTGLLFSDSLQIPNGKAALPPLLWKATKTNLYIYALSTAAGITEDSTLYQAPFFNIYEDGRVCMGTVKINIDIQCSLQQFMQSWQQYFFNSYFSHLLGNQSPVKGNIVQLWQGLVNTRRKFPIRQLKPHYLTMNELL
jgi:PRTRC genetic system protein B